ncbi:MAG: cofactor-independent phosphoglycerate mutase [Deltaproteobacteria bacterium]|nr:cofactor-independent phosphoglycerate mutase [Deltaproteobacteria bacterium]
MSSKTTKYIVLVGDGMADYPLKELGARTPLEFAKTPNMDRIASCGIGLAVTVPAGMEPGSDVANMCLLGYDPTLYQCGRSPLEAASMGVSLTESQVAFRMNLVNLDWRPDGKIIMVSHSSGDITTGEAGNIVETLKKEMGSTDIKMYPGVAYRHLLVWEEGPEKADTIPPHNVLDRDMSSYLDESSDDPVTGFIRRSWPILKGHPVNAERRRAGLREANSIWLWGQGKAPKIQPFMERFGLKGGVISAVDLIKGIGVYLGFRPIHVEGATGYLNTNYRGKAEGALKGLEDLDFMLVHVEAPDEAGHNGNYRDKIQAIESFDRDVVGVVLEGLKKFEDYRVMVISDHFTPIVKKTHVSDPTPFALAGKRGLESPSGKTPFTEAAAKESGLFFTKGHELMPYFLSLRDKNI